MEDEGEKSITFQRGIVYYRRLIGENLFGTQKQVVQQKSSIYSVMSFCFYYFLAITVIINRSEIRTQFSVNSALRQVLEETPFVTSPRSTFADVSTVDEAIQWLEYALLPLLCQGEACTEPECKSRGLPFSLQSFNRVLPPTWEDASKGVSGGDNAHVRVTLRKMKTLDSPFDSVGEKFMEFVPKTWQGFKLNDPTWTMNSTEANPADQVDPIIGTYLYKGKPSNFIPKNDNSTSPPAVGEILDLKWEYCGSTCGYGQKGGYVLDIALTTTESMRNIVKAQFRDAPYLANPEEVYDTITREQMVYFYKPGDDSAGKPTGEWHGFVPVFESKKIFDTEVTFLAIELWSYNANYQTFSHIRIPFEWNAGGLLDSKKIQVDTITLERSDAMVNGVPTEVYEIVYLFLTMWQFLSLCYRSYRMGMEYFVSDIWTWIDLASAFASFTSIFFFWDYLDDGRQYTEQQKIPREWGPEWGTTPGHSQGMHGVFESRLDKFRVYYRVSAFAVLLIGIRIIKVLGNTFSRVKLLQYTLWMSTPPIFWYFMYMSVLFFGFANFGQLNFAMTSGDFRTFHSTTVTCFSMFLGNIDAIASTRGHPLSFVFTLSFMFAFFFISVQMFNSIINYAYNTSREEMEPQFARERLDAKARQQLNANKPSMAARIREWIQMFRRRRGARIVETAKKDDRPKAIGPSLDGVKESVREKVETALRIEKEKAGKSDSIADIGIFIFFATCYYYFLNGNLTVPQAYQMSSTVNSAVFSAAYSGRRVDGVFEPVAYKAAINMDEIDSWLTRALPSQIFESEGRTAPKEINTPLPFDPMDPSLTIQPQDNYCFSGWNCLLSKGSLKQMEEEQAALVADEATENTGVGDMLRITVRKMAMVPNDDEVSSHLVPMRANCSSTGQFLLAYETTDDKWAENAACGCNYREPSAKFSGGYECMYPLDREVFTKSMDCWRREYAFSLETQSVVFEFVTFNANYDMMAYTFGEILVSPAGTVSAELETSAFVMRSSLQQMAELLVFLAGYTVCLFYYTYQQFMRFKTELLKKLSLTRATVFQILPTCAYEYLKDDPFNILDLISIQLSLQSLLQFFLFLNITTGLTGEFAFANEVQTGTWAELLNTMGGIRNQNKVYKRISAANIVIIFARVLKFFREQPRMTNLSATLTSAAADTVFFVVMLLVVMFGFVMFCHVSFGPQLDRLSTVYESFNYCFGMIIGDYNFAELNAVDSLMAHFFFFFFLIIFQCVFLNIFFAIIDCFFVNTSPPPANVKALLKPYFGNLPLLRYIQWDDDVHMETTGKEANKKQPPSRTDASKNARQKIDALQNDARKKGETDIPVDAKDFLELGLDAEEKFEEVMVWARDEARKYIDVFTKLKDERQNYANINAFIEKKKRDLQTQVRVEEGRAKDVERKMKYSLQLYEASAYKDLDTVSRYMLLLEHKIKRAGTKKMRLNKEMDYMRRQAELLQYTEAELDERQRNAEYAQPDDSNQMNGEDRGVDDGEGGHGQLVSADVQANVVEEVEPDGILTKDQSTTRQEQRKEFLRTYETNERNS